MNQRIATLLAAAMLTLPVAACGSDGPAGESAGQPAPPERIAEPPGGDELALGQRAVSPFVDYGSSNKTPTKVAVTVAGVRKGRIADLKDFNLTREQRRFVPYYVEAKFENLGRFVLTRHLLRASVEDADGREYRPATLIVLGGTFKPCPQGSDTKLRPGESFTGCSAVLLPTDAELDRVRFQGDVTKDPVFWQPQ